jgi:hypothetical protein
VGEGCGRKFEWGLEESEGGVEGYDEAGVSGNSFHFIFGMKTRGMEIGRRTREEKMEE